MKPLQRQAFTFPEAMAALVLAAIVLPVVMHAAAIAGRASQDGRRREQATRLAELKLQELVISDQWKEREAEGRFDEYPAYTWEFETLDWTPDDSLGSAMTQLDVTVRYARRNREESVTLTTLVQGGEL